MALQKLVWTSAVHAVRMAKGGCRLNLPDTQLILPGVNFALVLHGLASVRRLRMRLKGSVQQVPWNGTEAASEKGPGTLEAGCRCSPAQAKACIPASQALSCPRGWLDLSEWHFHVKNGSATC